MALSDPSICAELQRTGLSPERVPSARLLSCTEHRLLPDSAVLACGRAEVSVDPSGSAAYRDAPRRVAIAPAAPGKLILADCHDAELWPSLGARGVRTTCLDAKPTVSTAIAFTNRWPPC